jgi:hypothetical protein
MMRGRRREKDSGKKALAFSLHPFEPMDVVYSSDVVSNEIAWID